MVELVRGGSVINRATPTSLYIRVDFEGRCGEASEALQACNTGLAPTPPMLLLLLLLLLQFLFITQRY